MAADEAATSEHDLDADNNELVVVDADMDEAHPDMRSLAHEADSEEHAYVHGSATAHGR